MKNKKKAIYFFQVYNTINETNDSTCLTYDKNEGLKLYDDNKEIPIFGNSGNNINLSTKADLIDGKVPFEQLPEIKETDPTVPEWAKKSTKPQYEFSEIKNAPDFSMKADLIDGKVPFEQLTIPILDDISKINNDDFNKHLINSDILKLYVQQNLKNCIYKDNVYNGDLISNVPENSNDVIPSLSVLVNYVSGMIELSYGKINEKLDNILN
jgi:hypothetical protein